MSGQNTNGFRFFFPEETSASQPLYSFISACPLFHHHDHHEAPVPSSSHATSTSSLLQDVLAHQTSHALRQVVQLQLIPLDSLTSAVRPRHYFCSASCFFFFLFLLEAGGEDEVDLELPLALLVLQLLVLTVITNGSSHSRPAAPPARQPA